MSRLGGVFSGPERPLPGTGKPFSTLEKPWSVPEEVLSGPDKVWCRLEKRTPQLKEFSPQWRRSSRIWKRSPPVWKRPLPGGRRGIADRKTHSTGATFASPDSRSQVPLGNALLAKFHFARACPPGAVRRSTASGKGALPSGTWERVSEGSRNRSTTLPPRHNTACLFRASELPSFRASELPSFRASELPTNAKAAVRFGKMSVGRFTGREGRDFRRSAARKKMRQMRLGADGEFRVARSSRVLVSASRRNELSKRVATESVHLICSGA